MGSITHSCRHAGLSEWLCGYMEYWGQGQRKKLGGGERVLTIQSHPILGEEKEVYLQMPEPSELLVKFQAAPA